MKSAGLEEVRKELSKLQLDSYEVVADIGLTSAETVGFKVRVSPNEETSIGYDPANSELFVDRTHSGESSFHKDFAAKHTAKLDIQDGRLQATYLRGRLLGRSVRMRWTVGHDGIDFPRSAIQRTGAFRGQRYDLA